MDQGELERVKDNEGDSFVTMILIIDLMWRPRLSPVSWDVDNGAESGHSDDWNHRKRGEPLNTILYTKDPTTPANMIYPNIPEADLPSLTTTYDTFLNFFKSE